MTGQEIRDMDLTYNLHSWSKQKGLNPVVITKAEGIYLWDSDGKRYMDMSSGQVNSNVGHGNKNIIEAIKEQADKYCFISPSLAVEPRAKLAKMVIDRMPDNMGKVFFTNGGADANENAIKMARMYTGRYKVMSRYRSYHGSTFGAGNLTGEPRRYPLEPGIPGFIKFFDPYIYREAISFASEEDATKFYITKLREQIIYENPSTIAAIVMETITGSNGVIIPPKGYLEGVRKLCDEFGIMMICDEVMAGWCRTGKMFAFEHFNVKPDIVTFAKGITCGYIQLGGVAVSRTIVFDPSENRSALQPVGTIDLEQTEGRLCGKIRLRVQGKAVDVSGLELRNPADGETFKAAVLGPTRLGEGECSIGFEAEASVGHAAGGLDVIRGTITYANPSNGQNMEREFVLPFRLITK